MLRATCVCATLLKKPDVRKDYSATVRAIVVEEPPAPWTEVEVDAQFTVTLLAFAWALLPVGFMVMMAIFDRYQTHRLPLAAGALVMLSLAFTSGVGQRRSAWSEGRIQLATASLLSTGLVLVLVWWFALEAWWWVPYGLVFGSVATMFVALNHLSSCTTPTLRCAWPASSNVPAAAFHEWRIQNANWTNGTMGSKHLPDGTVLTLFGSLEGETTYLCIDRLCPPEVRPGWGELSVDFRLLGDPSNAAHAEE